MEATINGTYDRMFDALERNGGKYDMIGMSVYPYWAEQNGETGWLAEGGRRLYRQHFSSQTKI